MGKELYRGIFDVLEMEMGTVLKFSCYFPTAHFWKQLFPVLQQMNDSISAKY
jgi:hypothetical protein